MIKKILQILIWPFRALALLCFLVLLFLGSSEIGGRIRVNSDFQPAEEGVEIFVISNGIHTDIAVPYINDQANWREMFPLTDFQPTVSESSPTSYVAFGWGDKGLYENVPTWADLTLPIASNSLLLPTQSAMHVTFLRAAPKTGEWVKKVQISENQYDILIEEIKRSFTMSADNQPISLNCCWYGNIHDNFYASDPSYHLLRTCNNWTNRVLRNTGVPTALWTPNHQHILRHLDD